MIDEETSRSKDLQMHVTEVHNATLQRSGAF